MLYAIYQRDFGGRMIVTRATKAPATSKMFRGELKRNQRHEARAWGNSQSGQLLLKKQVQKVVNDKIKKVRKKSSFGAGDP